MDPKVRAAHEADITRALMRLGSARREKLDRVDFEVFVDGLAEFPSDVVTAVCLELGRVAPAEFQPRFPPLSVIRELCHRRVTDRVSHQRALAAPPVSEQFPPISDEKWAEIRKQFETVLRRRTMPDAGVSPAATPGRRD